MMCPSPGEVWPLPPTKAVQVAKTLGGYPVVIKAQIHAGGRGKGGGVKLAQSEPEVAEMSPDRLSA